MSYTESTTLEGRIRDYLKLSATDRAEYIDPRIATRRERVEHWVARTLRDAVSRTK
jgi:hypothetical protein